MRRGLWLFLFVLLSILRTGMAESMLIVSDMHLTANQAAHARTLAAVRQAAAGQDIVLLLGDNTNNGHPEEHAAVLSLAGNIRAETGAMVLVIPGNHDFSVHYDLNAYRADYGAFGQKQAFSLDGHTASCAVMTPGGICLLLLDTNRPDAGGMPEPAGGISDDTLAWLKGVLKDLPDGTPVIACGHHPILPDSRSRQTPGAAALSDLLRISGVRLYLCGHDHGFDTVQSGTLRQITVGQPHAFPGWAGSLQLSPSQLLWQPVCIWDQNGAAYAAMARGAEELAAHMARGTLEGTVCEGDEGAIRWFSAAFMHRLRGTLTPAVCAALLADENCGKWRRIETRTVVRDWMLDLLENCPEEILRITIPLREREEARP